MNMIGEKLKYFGIIKNELCVSSYRKFRPSMSFFGVINHLLCVKSSPLIKVLSLACFYQSLEKSYFAQTCANADF